MFAQSLVEYGALASITDAAARAADSAETWIGGHASVIWIAIGALVLAALVAQRRRASRL